MDNVAHWFKELDDAKKRHKPFVKEGERILKIYDGDTKVPFNILYSNTDTLIPALFSATPRPVIRRRFKDNDPLAFAACEAGKRMLEYLLDTNMDGYETFNEGVLNAVIDATLPGRGVTQIKYDAEVGEYAETGDDESDQDPAMVKESELICVDSKSWDKVLFGYARKWSKVPWIAFEEIIDKDEAVRLFGEEMAGKIQYSKNEENEEPEKEDQGERKTASIYVIWDKDGGRKVRYVSLAYKDEFLKVVDDPLELTGFFPIPKPLQFVAKSNDLKVTPPYLMYEAQAKELNEITLRIQKLTKAIKAKFVYDSELKGDIENLMTGDDLEGIPAEKSSALSADKGFENALWFLPIEKLIAVVNQLYAAREQCKQVIYEITGISDIIRGSTAASETATAQSIKSQWGTMRLKRSQAEVQRYCRDLMRLMLEVAATKFSEESWAGMTGLPYATDAQMAQAQQIVQYPADQAAPQLQQMIQQAQQTLKQPQWSQVLGLLKNDVQRSFKIDIETNSTVMTEATEDKQNINEALATLGGFIENTMPVVEKGVLPFEAFKAILLKISRQFDFGEEVENEISQITQPQPPAAPQDNSVELKQIEKDTEQGKALTQMKIEQMRIESAEKIAKYQADVQADTQLKIAMMGGVNA